MTNIISIAVFMLCVQLSIGAVSTFNLFGTNQVTTTPPQSFSVSNTILGWNLSGYGSIATFAVLSIFASIGLIFAAFYSWLGVALITVNMAAYIDELFSSAGFNFIPPVLLAMLTSIISVVLILGAISMLTGRSRRLGNE